MRTSPEATVWPFVTFTDATVPALGVTISFSISKILDVYLFLFPIFFIIFNFVMLHKNKYNKLVIIIDYIFQIINPITIGFFVSAFLLVINKEYPI